MVEPSKKRHRIGVLEDSSSNYLDVPVCSLDSDQTSSEHPDVDVMYMTRKQFEAYAQTCPQRLLKYKAGGYLSNGHGYQLFRSTLLRFINLKFTPITTELDKVKLDKQLAEWKRKDERDKERKSFKAGIFYKRMKETGKKFKKLGMFEEKKSLEFQGLILSEVCI